MDFQIPSIESITDQVMNAQAELQTPLGFLRCELSPELANGPLTTKQRESFESIENRLAKTLARLHALLCELGHPMYGPARHDDVPYPVRFMARNSVTGEPLRYAGRYVIGDGETVAAAIDLLISEPNRKAFVLERV